jgi:hypothetical protein
VIVDALRFKLPAELRSNEVRIVAGVYATPSERLKLSRGEGDQLERALVTTLKVAPPGTAMEAWVPRVALDKLDTDAPITIDGKLNEPAWKKATVLGPFVEVKTGNPTTKRSLSSEARMLFDDDALYVAWEVEDQDVVGGLPPGAKRMPPQAGDAVQMLLDPAGDGDGKDYYGVRVNPQNLVFGSFYERYGPPKKDGGPPPGIAWASRLESAVVVNGTLDKSDDKDKGYVVEAMLPWKSFNDRKRAPPKSGDTWRINLYAFEEGARVGWSAIGDGSAHQGSRFARVRFNEKEAAAGTTAREGEALRATGGPRSKGTVASGAARPSTPVPSAAP